MAEIRERSRPHPFEIAAIGGKRQIQRQNLALRIAHFQLNGAQGLDQLVAIVARVRTEQARRLHGDGRTAGDDIAGVDIGQQRPHNRGGIDAGMEIEALVLNAQQAADKRRIGTVKIGADTPAAVIYG